MISAVDVCKEILGKTEREAKIAIATLGFKFRTLKRDRVEFSYPPGEDLERINITVEEDKVVRAEIG